MSEFNLKNFLRYAKELILVFSQFFIIALHFFQWEIIPNKKIFEVNTLSYSLGILIIIFALIVMFIAIKDLGSNLSPFPRPITNGKLVTKGIYGFTRHPMYYSLIFISFGVFIIRLSIYYLFLTLSLASIIKFKIILEEKYLNNKFKNYVLYKNDVKY